MTTALDTFTERMYQAQNAPDRLTQLANLMVAVENLGLAVKALDDRLDGIETWLDSFAQSQSAATDRSS